MGTDDPSKLGLAEKKQKSGNELIEFSRMGSGVAEDSACWFYSCSFGVFVVEKHPGRMGGRRGLVIDRVADTVLYQCLLGFEL